MPTQQKKQLVEYLQGITYSDVVRTISYSEGKDVVIICAHGWTRYTDRITPEGEVIYQD